MFFTIRFLNSDNSITAKKNAGKLNQLQGMNKMSIIQKGGHCPTCDKPRTATKEKINHILHLILSVITVGVWIPVWLLLLLFNFGKSFRCTSCGTKVNAN